MASLKRQITEPEKEAVLAQKRRNGLLFCFVDDHRIEDGHEVEFHHIKPFSEDGPTEVENIGAVCKRRMRALSLSEFRDHLLMSRFFDHQDPRRLDDLLALKLSENEFGLQVKVERNDRDSSSPVTR